MPDLNEQINAAEKYAEQYNDDPRDHIKTDVINAFYAGVDWNRQHGNTAQAVAHAWFHRGMVNFDSEEALAALDDGKGTPIPLFAAPPVADAEGVDSRTVKALADEHCTSHGLCGENSAHTFRPVSLMRFANAIAALSRRPAAYEKALVDSAIAAHTRASDGLGAVREAVTDYYRALDNRQHGGVAQNNAFAKIEEALGMSWSAHREAMQQAASNQQEGA